MIMQLKQDDGEEVVKDSKNRQSSPPPESLLVTGRNSSKSRRETEEPVYFTPKRVKILPSECRNSATVPLFMLGEGRLDVEVDDQKVDLFQDDSAPFVYHPTRIVHIPPRRPKNLPLDDRNFASRIRAGMSAEDREEFDHFIAQAIDMFEKVANKYDQTDKMHGNEERLRFIENVTVFSINRYLQKERVKRVATFSGGHYSACDCEPHSSATLESPFGEVIEHRSLQALFNKPLHLPKLSSTSTSQNASAACAKRSP